MSNKTDFPKAPAHLAAPTRAWWDSCVREYELASHHLRLLRLACESWDRCQQAREILDKEGLTFTDRLGNVRPRPEASIERDCRIAFARLCRELRFDDGEPEAPRPPQLNRGE